MKILKNQNGNVSLSESTALKAVSLIMALTLWITILGFKREEMKKNIKFEPLLPPGMMIVSKVPPSIQYTFSGPRIMLKNVEKQLQPIRPDLRRSRETTVGITVSADLLGDIGTGVKVVSFSPLNVILRLEEIIERYVTVRPTWKGTIANGYEMRSVQVIPSKIAVSGPRSLVEGLETIGTEYFDIENLTDSKEGTVGVEVDEAQGLSLSRDRVVKVKVAAKRVLR